MLNVYIVEINLCSFNLGANFTLGNSSFGTVKLTKNVDRGKYSYSGYDNRFDERRSFSLSDGSGFGKNVTILGADNSSSVHSDNRNKQVWVDAWQH